MADEGVHPAVLVFLHIPKTAGSTFHALLNSRYKKSEICNVFGSRFSEPEIKEFIEADRAAKSDIKLLKGHMPFGLHEYLPRKAKYITMLRNPVERVISQYYYVKKNVHNPLHERVHLGGMSLSDFVSSGISIGMNNGQCRFLNGDLDEFPFATNHEELYESASQNLNSHFIWVGLTERFDESVLVLHQLLGWRDRPHYIRENVSQIRKQTAEIDDKELQVIKELNSFDILLYERAGRLLDEKIAGISNFPDFLQDFRDTNRRLQARWGWAPGFVRRFVL